MTNARQIRGRRWLAALVAAMLMASVLSVVTAGPTQAANTSGEELIDTDGDGVPDSREFAGAHRYDTAVRLAERFAGDEDGVFTVIIASGETQVDAVTAAGLAGNLNAPVLLTRSNQLPHNVARFIDDHNVTEVIVVGGTAAVPDAILTAIEGLGSRPGVVRYDGADRYATAARIGNELGGPNPTWCGSTQTAAVLVNGGDAGRADAVIAGPLAFRLGLPVLLTAADELPEPTAAFLTDNKVERVVVIGGTEAVSDEVVETLVEEVGVVTARRISGGSAAATSVMVAKEMLGDCAEVLGTNPDMVALVNRDAIADGIAAAPVLGRGLGDDGGSVPILLVGDELPAEVSEYLASTAEVRGGQKTHMSILAIGGTAAVSDTVMAHAVEAAKTSDELTATVALPVTLRGGGMGWLADLDAGGGHVSRAVSIDDAVEYATWGATTYNDIENIDAEGFFLVDFSDEVTIPAAGESVKDTVLDPNLYLINGRRVEALADDAEGNAEYVQLVNVVSIGNKRILVLLSHVLEAGDVVTVVGGDKVGANGDQRKLTGESVTVPELPSNEDREAPAVRIVGAETQQTFSVLVNEPNLIYNELTGQSNNLTDFVRVDGRDTRDVTVTEATLLYEPPADGPFGVTHRYTVTVDAPLEAGDVLIVERNAFRDENGRGNSLQRFTVPETMTQGQFGIESISIGDYRHAGGASATIGSGTADEDPLWIQALPRGSVYGAPGNDWVIFGFDNRADGENSTKAFDIDVAVDMRHSVISYTISDAQPAKDIGRVATLFDLATALLGNDDFVTNFFVRWPNAATSDQRDRNLPLGATDPAGARFVGGITTVGVRVKFNDAVQEFTNNRADLISAVAPDAPHSLSYFNAPDDTLDIEYASNDMKLLPERVGYRVIPAGVATSYGDGDPDTVGVQPVTSVRKVLHAFRPDPSIVPRNQVFFEYRETLNR